MDRLHWWDLCAGPHVESTGAIDPEGLELESVAGVSVSVCVWGGGGREGGTGGIDPEGLELESVARANGGEGIFFPSSCLRLFFRPQKKTTVAFKNPK